jgi:DNA modification methylase
MRIYSPKRQKTQLDVDRNWYNYYAGYSSRFVRDLLGLLRTHGTSTVLDPWNGSGTTTFVAEQLGYSAYGYDINPVMVIVSKARHLSSNVSASLDSVCNELLEKSLEHYRHVYLSADPLETWFDPVTAKAHRSIERAIQALLIDPRQSHDFHSPEALSAVSSLAAFFYVALFRITRSSLTQFLASNPTWIKIPRAPEQRAVLSPSTVFAAFKREVAIMAEKALSLDHTSFSLHQPASVNLADSRALPLADRTIDIVITSPPYCTRLDYVVATLPELATLGYQIGPDVKGLRDRMIGTPTITTRPRDQIPDCSHTLNRFLDSVCDHSSKASSTYYQRTFAQYFAGLYQSLREIARTLRPHGTCCIVIQDSYYKDVYLDLAKILSELALSCDLVLTDTLPFSVPRTFSGIHRHARKYRDKSSATESVLIFRKD